MEVLAGKGILGWSPLGPIFGASLARIVTIVESGERCRSGWPFSHGYAALTRIAEVQRVIREARKIGGHRLANCSDAIDDGQLWAEDEQGGWYQCGLIDGELLERREARREAVDPGQSKSGATELSRWDKGRYRFDAVMKLTHSQG